MWPPRPGIAVKQCVRSNSMVDPADPTALDAARLLAEWYLELGYLERADAVQFLHDMFGEVFVGATDDGRMCFRRDVICALQHVAPLAVAALPEICGDDSGVLKGSTNDDAV